MKAYKFVLPMVILSFMIACGGGEEGNNDNGPADTTSPTVAVTSDEFFGTSKSPFQVMITFSESVEEFDAGAVTVSNGSASNVQAGSNNSYTVDITPAGYGDVSVNVLAGAVQDAAGNNNSAADAFSVGYYKTTDDISILASKFYTDDVTFVVSASNITITTKVLPDHKSVYYPANDPLYEDYTTQDDADFRKNPGEILEQNVVFTLPRFPEEASNKQGPGGGPMGVAINSVVFFNQEAAGDDDIFEEIKTFDQWEGHPAGNTFHYHIESPWFTDGSNPNMVGATEFMGLLQDGFPVYGPMENGEAVTNDILDIYHGHIGPTTDFPDGIYHYHITDEFPWINGDAYYGAPGTQTN